MVLPIGDPVLDLEGGAGGYNPSAPSGGGPATNYGSQMAAAYGTPGKSQMPLFVGKGKPGPGAPNPNIPSAVTGAKNFTQQPIYMTPVQLLASFDSFNRKDYLRFRNLLIAAGLVPETVDPAGVRSTYQSIIYDAMDMQAGGVQMSPMAMIKNLIRQNGLDPKKIGADEDYGASLKESLKPSKTTATTVYDLTPEDAKATLEQAIQQKLGRAPTRAEIEDFIAAAQTRAQNNPTTVTEEFIPGEARKGAPPGSQVTVQEEDGQVIGSTVTTVDQGFDADSVARMAEKRAKNAPDYASYQAVSTYFPALVQALGSTV